MTGQPICLILISGPVGVGKTTVAEELSTLFERRDVAHTLIDLDVLAETYPRPADDPFNRRLAMRNLRDVWSNCVAAGSGVLILPRVIETPEDVAEITAAVPGSRAVVFQLRATDEVLIDHVRKREIGSGREWHEKRAIELAEILSRTGPANYVVDTDGRSISEIAREILEWFDGKSRSVRLGSDA